MLDSKFIVFYYLTKEPYQFLMLKACSAIVVWKTLVNWETQTTDYKFKPVIMSFIINNFLVEK